MFGFKFPSFPALMIIGKTGINNISVCIDRKFGKGWQRDTDFLFAMNVYLLGIGMIMHSVIVPKKS